MNEFLLRHEPAVRLAFFVGVFAAMAAWEQRAPRRVPTQSKALRWTNNVGVALLNGVVLRLLFPAAAVGMAALAEERGWGLFHYLGWSQAAAFVPALVLLDGAIFLQHVLFHAAPTLWRLHRVHHTDMDFDLTTGARFHPLEIVLSMVLKFGVVAAIGATPAAVLAFEVLLNATSMFNHSNVALPGPVDRALRWILVTPDMHRVHHSVVEHEANSNYGFNLSAWDRLLGTYLAQPAQGHDGMTIGIAGFRDAKFETLPWMLVQPFLGKVEDYAINRRRHGDGS